ncbi:MAG TPA: hypothetical protein VFK66_01480 [Oryzihumus sp.]|nr:hypothetical protein [Oryzihumus sp.]
MSEHLLVLPEREVAEELADDLALEDFAEVRVIREALAGEDDAEDHDWAVYVRDVDGTDPAPTRSRLQALAEAHDGWYDPDPFGRGA